MSERTPDSSSNSSESAGRNEATLFIDTGDMARENAERVFAAMDEQKARVARDSARDSAGKQRAAEHASGQAAQIQRDIELSRLDFNRSSVLANLANDRRWGRMQAERDDVVEHGKLYIENAISNDGLTVEQSEFALQSQLDDIEDRDNFADSLIKNGNLEEAEANKRADERYAAKDARRKQFIKENNITTAEEYAEAKKAAKEQRAARQASGGAAAEAAAAAEGVAQTPAEIVDAWEEQYKDDGPLVDREKTLQDVQNYFDAATELINGSPASLIHNMDPDTMRDNEQYKKFMDSLDQIARSRGCEDEDLIQKYKDRELFNLMEASAQYENTTEMVVSSDPAEIKAYWENYVKDQGIAYEDFISSENTALIKKPARVSPGEPVPRSAFGDPDPGENPLPGTAEVPAAGPERKKRDWRKIRRIGAAFIAAASSALALGGGYAAGRGHENYIVKSHDTPVVDTINKSQDGLREASVDESVQEEIGRNYGAFESLVNHDQSSVKQDGAKLEKAYQAKVKEVRKNNPTATPEEVKDMANALVDADLVEASMK